MPDIERERKIASAKRKLQKFKKKRHDLKATADDISSLASEDTIDENLGGDSSKICNANSESLLLSNENSQKYFENDQIFTGNVYSVHEEQVGRSVVQPIETVDFSVVTDNESNSENHTTDIIPLPDASMPSTVEDAVTNSSNTEKLAHEPSEVYADEKLNTNILLDDSSPPLLEQHENANTFDTHYKKEEIFSIQNNVHCESSINEAEISSATTEKLLQISTKLNGLAAEAQSFENGSSFTSADQFMLTELENRNQQLAGQVSSLMKQKQELLVQLDQLTQQMKELHHRLESEKQQIYTHGINEQNSLRQQLQVQMQTISILVAEKQELQHQVHEAKSSVNQEQNSKQKYQDQLRDTKLRAQNLERDLKSHADSLSHLTETKDELTQERDQLQAKLQKLTRSNDENSMNASELSQKLSNKEEECKRLRIELDDLHEKLSMAEVLLQQLSNAPGDPSDSQLKQIQEERESLNQKLIEYQQAFEQLTSEREQLSRQYEDVNRQMQKQVNELSEQVTLLENDKSRLESEVDELRDVVRTSEEKNQQNDENNEANSKDENVEKELRLRLEQSDRDFAKVLAERDDVINKLSVQQRNNERLAKLNEEQELKLNEMSENMSESVVSAEEHAKLLEQSQSDKTTISRALIQNKQLKQQLEEMQEGFIKLQTRSKDELEPLKIVEAERRLQASTQSTVQYTIIQADQHIKQKNSNDKMELATQLTTTEHAKREMEEEIEKHEVSLSLIKEEISTKDKTVTELQNALLQAQLHVQSSPQQPNSSNINDGLRMELTTSQETVSILGEQNNQLKAMVTTLQQQLDEIQQQIDSADVQPARVASSDFSESNTSASSGSFDDDEKDQDTVSFLSTSLQQLEHEKEELARRFEVEQQEHAALLEQFEELKQSRTSSDISPPQNHQQLVHNMALLQDRFTKVMKEKVEALTRVEDLEHVNLQLQNECDTIGEYITLYHNQRQILKQRHHEKDEYVSAMAQEREQMRLKLEKLQSLVLSLLNNRGANTPPPTHSPLSSSPVKTKGQQMTREIDTIDISSEWPVMLDEEESSKSVRTSRPDLLPDPETLRSNSNDATPPSSNLDEEPHKSDHFPGKLERVDASSEEEDSTATEIISLLAQMQNPSKSASVEFPQGFCLRYMGPYTAI